MDLEEESRSNPNSTPKLPLLSMAAPMFQSSPQQSGTQTPPLRPTASIPFQWEEQPGKARPCTSLIPLFTTTNNEPPRCLELPPRLLIPETHKNISSPSPVTVLGGPYPYVSRSARFISSSFRLFRERQGSFDSIGSSKSPNEDEDRALRGDFGGIEIQRLQKNRGFFGSWKRKKKPKIKEIGSASFVYRSSSSISMEEASNRFWNWDDDDDAVFSHNNSNRISNARKLGSFSLAKSQFWAAVCEGIKQVIPWKRKNS